MMSDNSEAPEAGTTNTRTGVVYALLAAASTAVLLFLPVLLLGITMSVVVSVLKGDIVGWRGSVDMTFAFIGIPALLSLFLLRIPYLLFHAAARRIGSQRTIRWVGGVLVAWNAGVAVIWAVQAMSRSTPAIDRPEIWYAAAFGIAAVVILIATVLAERRARRAAIALSGALAVALVALVAVLVSVWGSPPRIPASAQVVRVAFTDSEVRLNPATVHAGAVYFVVEGSADPAGHEEFTFVSRGYGAQCCDHPLPMSDEDVARLAKGDSQGTGSESGWGTYAKFTLSRGKYAFLVLGPAGDQPCDALHPACAPPQSMTVLEVLP